MNISSNVNKFMTHNWFGKKIILVNKAKVSFSVNAKFDEFLRKIVALDVLLFYSYTKAISQAIHATFHNNCYTLITKLLYISLLVKYMIDNSIFKKKSGRTSI